MNKQVRWITPAVTLLIILALTLPGCARVQNAASVGAAQLAAPAAPDRAAMLKYLKAAREDLDIIDKVILDEELGMTDDSESTSDEEFTDEDAARYADLLFGYSIDVKDTIAAVNARQLPDDANIAAFQAAELNELALTAELIEEYTQVLGYYDLIMEVYEYIDETEKIQTEDLQALYSAYNDAITKAIDTLTNGNIPTCLKSMNDGMISALNDMNSAVLYLLNSYALTDPLRQDAALYRWEILLRKFSAIVTRYNKDIEERQTKLTADAKNILGTNDGLKKWLDDNIDKLD